MRKFLATVTPDLDAGAATGSAYSDNDILFGWTKFDIPNGCAELMSITATIAGTNGAAGNAHDIGLYFARAIDGVAPASFGTIHGATAATTTAAFRRNIIAFCSFVQNNMDDDDHLIGYDVYGDTGGNRNHGASRTIMQGDETPFPGDSTYSATPQGYQSLWVAGIAHGAFDFGTDVTLDQAGNQAASTAATLLTLDGTGDPRKSFQPGDILIGSTGGPTMEVVSIGGDTAMSVKNISEQIDDDEELVLQYPIRFHFGFNY